MARKSAKQSAAQKKGAARLKRMHAEAKRIQKKNPRKKYSTCLKEAGKKIK